MKTGLIIERVHHIAIICSDYKKSKAFYTEILGFEVLRETYRQERQSHKLDLSINGSYIIELFSFPHPPKRPTRPESTGLRHIAFEVANVEESKNIIEKQGVTVEPIRVDECTGKKFTFFNDPDELPIEIYER